MTCVRKATPADVPALAELIESAVALQQELAGTFAITDDCNWLAFASAKLADASRSLLVAADDATVLGFIEVRIHGYIPPNQRSRLRTTLSQLWKRVRRSAPVAVIEDVYVVPSARHRGVATNLVDRAVEDLKSVGVREVFAAIWASNEPSMRFHEQLGFTRTTVTLQRTLEREHAH